MATINGLTTLAVADVTGSDFLPIYDASAGTDKKTPLFDASTWTPVLSFGGASTGITYTTQTGEYVRIGDLVYVVCKITLSSKGSATGTAIVTGLPVASGVSLSAGSGVILAAGASLVDFRVMFTSSQINLYYATAAYISVSAMTDAQFGDTTQLYIAGTYSA